MKTYSISVNYVKMKAYHLTSFFSGRVRTLDDKIYSFRSCDDEAKDKMRGKYLDVLKKSSLRRLCNRYSDLCKKENVDVQC